MECLLPSEIARLVFGYLEEQKCDEAAQCFLEHSQYLSECLNVVRAGRKFSSRVQGCSLLDVLDEYCAVQSLVAERIRKLPESSSEQLQSCGGLVDKLKILLDNAKSGQTVAVSISVLPHSGTSQGSGTQGIVHSRSRVALSAHERKRSIRFQGQENKQKTKEREERNVSLECSVETTPLETLPGLSGQGSRSTETTTDRSIHSLARINESAFHANENVVSRASNEELFYSSFVSEQFSGEKGRSHSFSSTSTVPDKDTVQDINVNTCEVGTSTNTCAKRKAHCKKKSAPSKSSPIRIRKPLRGDDDEEEEEEEEEESVAATLHRALLNNTELHEKIAENINSVIRIPNDLGSNEMSCGPLGSEDCEGVIQELNNAIKMVVDKTQEDPVFERLLEEIIGPTDEDMSSSPTGVESETDDACDAPEALICDEEFIISKDTDDSDQRSVVVTELSQQTLTNINDGKQKDVVNLLVQASSEVPSHSGDQSFVSDKGKCENSEVTVAPNVDEIPQTPSETLPLINKSYKINVDKSSKKHSNSQQANQGKGKLSSANRGVASQDNDSSGKQLISKKEIRELRSLLENVDTVHTPKSDIPLKQRLRSARRSDTTVQGTIKDSSSVDRSLEDQNAKAIQLILEANKQSSQLLETENIDSSSDELPLKDINKKNSPTSSKKISDEPEKSNNIQKDSDTSDQRKEFQDSTSVTKEVDGSENNVDVNPAEELSNALNFDDNANKSTQNSDLTEDKGVGQTTSIEKEQIMMLTIPSVMSPKTSTSSMSISQTQTEQTSMQMTVSSGSQISVQETSNLPKPVFSQLQQQAPEHMSSPFSVLTLSQNVDDSVIESSKQLIMDETNSSAVIVCDSNMTFPPVFNQYLKGIETRENQPKKMRPIAPRPIRPKPVSSFPLQLITTDITPQYIVTQVSPTPLIERRNIVPPLSPGLLNVLNLTVPVISQTSEPVRKICVCTSEDCGKKCDDITEKNTHLILPITGGNSDTCGDSDLSSVSEHVPDNTENDSRNQKRVIASTRLSTSDDCGGGSISDGPNTTDAKLITLQSTTATTSKSKHNQDEILDMSSLLLLPEQMPKPRDTPQEFIAGKSSINTRRLSLSTPRRRASHIRALDFGTPQKSGTESIALKKSQTSPKPSKINAEAAGAISKVGFSSSPYKPLNNQVRNVRSSLFMSPDPPLDKKDEKNPSKENAGNSHVIPIATRSPVTHLLGDWDKATGVGLIFNGVSPENTVTRNVDHRPARITPKTLLFSPESENSSTSDQNQTPPSQNIVEPIKNTVKDFKHTESNELQSSLHDTEANNDLNTSGQKVSPGSMPIKQKLKSRSWDEDLRKLLSQDFEDVYVQKDSVAKETENDSVLQNKAVNTSYRDQATKKLKKKSNKKGNRRNGNVSDVEEHKTLNASNLEIENKQTPKIGTEEKEIATTNIQGNASMPESNFNRCTEFEKEKDKNPNDGHEDNCSDFPTKITDQLNTSARKRKADEMSENCLPKRSKPTSKEENAAGKTVEEVLECMFCEGKDNSLYKCTTPKEKQIMQSSNEIAPRSICDVLIQLNSTPDSVRDISAAPLQIESSHNLITSILDLAEKGGGNQEALETNSVSEKNISNCSIPNVKPNGMKDNLAKDSSEFSSEKTMITTEPSSSSEKSNEVTEENNSLNASKKTDTNLEKSIDLETPIKNDVKYLFKNFNPMTPGSIDSLFPMTPRVLSPSHQEDTPMTKLLKGEPCINFSMIVTPSLPPTPNIMISPNSENQDSPTSYASRPTDYSSCSSYYNPSKNIDTPTKLEQELIKECNKIEENKKKSQEKLDKHQENSKNPSINITSDAKLSQKKDPDLKRAGSPNELQSLLKEVPTFQQESVSLNPNCSNNPSVRGAKEFESSNTKEKITHLIEQNTDPCQKDVKQNEKHGSLENTSDSEHHITASLIKKKNLNSEIQLCEKVALKSQIDTEGNNYIKDLSTQKEEKLPSEENRLKNELKTPESRSKEVSELCVKNQSQLCSEVIHVGVSDDAPTKQKSEEIQISIENTKINSQILRNVLEKGKITANRSENVADCTISQDQCENMVIEGSIPTISEGPKYDEVMDGEADCENTLQEKAINENNSIKPNKPCNPGKGSSKTASKFLNKQNSNTRKAENEAKKNVGTCASAKRIIRTGIQSAEMVHKIEEHVPKYKNEKKGKKSALTKEKFSSHKSINSSESSQYSHRSVENNRENVKATADGKNVKVNATAFKTKKITNVSDIQIVNKNYTEHVIQDFEKTSNSVTAKKPDRINLEKTSKIMKKGSSSKECFKVDVETNESIPSEKMKKKQLKDLYSSPVQVKESFAKSDLEFSSAKKDVNKHEKISNQTKATTISPSIERQRSIKKTPRIREMVRYHVSKTPPKSSGSLASKSKPNFKKRMEHKENIVNKKTKSEDIVSEKNENKMKNKQNSVNEPVNNKLKPKTEEYEKIKNLKSEGNTEKYKKDELGKINEIKHVLISNEDGGNENKNVGSINESETVHKKIDIEDKIRNAEPSEKNKDEEDERNENERLCKKNREVQIQNKENVFNANVHCDEVDINNHNVSMDCNKHENIITKNNLVGLSETTKIILENEENIGKEKLETSHSEKEEIASSVSKNLLKVSCTSFSESTLAVLKIPEIEQVNSCNISETVSSKRIDFSASGEEVDCEREEEKETSSSESDSDESSDDSSSDSSDESSIDSQDSFEEEMDKGSTEPVAQEDNCTSLRKTSSEDVLKPGNHVSCEKEEAQQSVKDQSGSETINEILKNVSSVSHIRQDMCFASELDEKKKRTLAKLKGPLEADQVKNNVGITANKEGENDEHSECQPVSCEPKQVASESNVEKTVERCWEDSSVEEFPVLHVSDSESAGNATPHVSPRKSPFRNSVLEIQNLNSTKSNAASGELSSKRVDSPIQNNMPCASNINSAEVNMKIYDNNSLQKSEEDCAKEVLPKSELNGNKDKSPTTEGCSAPSVNSLQLENTVCRYDNLESILGDRNSIVKTIKKMTENEFFIKLHYIGNFCPIPQAINHTNFSYLLDEDEITITGSQFQNLFEIPPKKVCDKPSCTKKHENEQEIENKSSVGHTKSVTTGEDDNQEFGDSNSGSTILIEEKDKQSCKTSSKLRPLDILYEEMMRCNDSSSLSDEADISFKKKSKGLPPVMCDKKKTSIGKSHQRSLKVSENSQRTFQENIRYQSPLEMISEYQYQKEDQHSSSYIRGDSKIKDQTNSKKEVVYPEGNNKLRDLEEGEILDSPVKESSSSATKTRGGDSSRFKYRSGSRHSGSSDGSTHSYSSHRSKTRSSETSRRETYGHHKNEKQQTSAASSHHDDVRSLPPKKRKAVTDNTIKEPEKRARHENPCKLLKNLNIDSFLNKVHGEDPSK